MPTGILRGCLLPILAQTTRNAFAMRRHRRKVRPDLPYSFIFWILRQRST